MRVSRDGAVVAAAAAVGDRIAAATGIAGAVVVVVAVASIVRGSIAVAVRDQWAHRRARPSCAIRTRKPQDLMVSTVRRVNAGGVAAGAGVVRGMACRCK